MLKVTKRMKTVCVLSAVITASVAPPVLAGETVDVRVVITDVRATDAPLYISIQNKDDYRSSRAAGAVIVKSQTGKSIDKTFNVPAGEYAVSVWHDLDKDNAFSVDATWQPKDGWASSGGKLKGDPRFEDVKVNFVQDGQVVNLSMNYAAQK